MKIKEVTAALEAEFPIAYQEKYDNAGLNVGDPDQEFASALITIDVTEPVVHEAIETGANLIIAHHPLLFSPVKKITSENDVTRTAIKAIRNNIAIYCAHTNADNLLTGVNRKICEKLRLHQTSILLPAEGRLRKLVTFVPLSHAEVVRSALFDAGAGKIGQYDNCSFNTHGKGTFRASEGTHPFTGEIGQHHIEDEVRIETIFPSELTSRVVESLLREHPYEEVAYDIYPLENKYNKAGAGMIGLLNDAEDETVFFTNVKSAFTSGVIRHSPFLRKPVKRIAVCGGSGAFLIPEAIRAGADVFLTGDVKYHQFFEASGKIVVADIGHYESEQFTVEIFYEVLKKKFPNFAFQFSAINTNPINYF
jgi:dinuclear metal center YbgI/SA1388 family protein